MRKISSRCPGSHVLFIKHDDLNILATGLLRESFLLNYIDIGPLISNKKIFKKNIYIDI